MAKKKSKEAPKDIRNKKLHFKYKVEESFEAGIVLRGTEVKAIRQGDAQINESFCKVRERNIYLYNAHISEYSHGNLNNHAPTRARKLLLHQKEIDRIQGQIEAGGKTLVPAKIYFKKGLIKVEVALCTGKKLYDKREDLKKKDALREAERAMKTYR